MAEPYQSHERARRDAVGDPTARASKNARVADVRDGTTGDRAFEHRLSEHRHERMAALHRATARRRRVLEVDEQRAFESLDLEPLAHVLGECGERRLEATSPRVT